MICTKHMDADNKKKSIYCDPNSISGVRVQKKLWTNRKRRDIDERRGKISHLEARKVNYGEGPLNNMHGKRIQAYLKGGTARLRGRTGNLPLQLRFHFA